LKGKVKAGWHATHVMPANATRGQRVKWHAEHAEACGCRPAPDGLVAEVSAYKKGRAEFS
jgi:hypothetical protein